MLFYALLLCFVKGFVLGDDELSGHNCHLYYPDEVETFVIPDAESLPSICPKMIAYLECEQRVFIEEKVEVHPILNGTIDLIRSICEEESNYQKEYLASVDCFKNLESDLPGCHAAAQRIYLDYRLFITRFVADDDENAIDGQNPEEDDKDDSITYQEPYCMMTAYAVGCLGTKILDTCGHIAQKIFVDIIQRSKVLTQYCPSEEGERLRSEFLDYLNFEKEHSHIGIFRDVFDFKKKK